MADMKARGPLIIGGGPAGAAAAIRLAQAGARPVILERTIGPHDKVCGDFLTAEVLSALTSLGLNLSPLTPAPIREVRIIRGGQLATATLPFPAVGLSRRALDEALLARAAVSGAAVHRGVIVRSLRQERRTFHAATATGSLATETVFLATGKHDLRGATRPRSRRTVGLKAYVRLAPGELAALGEAVEIVLVSGGYAGLQMIEGGAAVLCALLTDARSPCGGIPRLVACTPHLQRRLQGATWLTARPLAVAGMPYGYVARPDGVFRLGDEAAVIPSFTGAGVAIALATGAAAAETYLASQNAEAFQRQVATSVARPVRLAGALHQALTNPALQEIAFEVARTWPGLIRWAARATRTSVG